MSLTPSQVQVENERIRNEYARRQRELPQDFYAPWQPAALLLHEERVRIAAEMLHQANAFPTPGDNVLEVGCGNLGWMADFLNFGLREHDLHAIEINPERLERVRASLPEADLRLGNGSELPWPNETFRFVVASTLFTSILSSQVRGSLAGEIMRVLSPGGTLLWYDFSFNNPWNKNVRKVDRRELKALFPELNGEVRLVSLAPPIARLVAPRSWRLAVMLEALPFLRSHLLAVLLKS